VEDTNPDGVPETVHLKQKAAYEIDAVIGDNGDVTFTENGKPAGTVSGEDLASAADASDPSASAPSASAPPASDPA
ncbi:hypothetical protein J8J20_26465, partial [Mycobacterium tuberculosis]|nr:hypothetical protein [Mycobacterium tuberculosis]